MWDVHECEFCGSPTVNEDCVCDACAKEFLLEDATLENAIAWGKEDKQCVEINGFLACICDAMSIEELIIKHVIPHIPSKYIEDFCMDDWMAFQDWIERRTA